MSFAELSCAAGNGLMFVAETPFLASALHYTIESLDEAPVNVQCHSNKVKPTDLRILFIDKVHYGLVFVDNCGAFPITEYH